ncbi:DUF3549 family protein [Lacimicrobium sp. SS2-24]|uniref:DUF3549 family protein n=1 Tax=Lacimicrobium sp. SS2-24 TaxID=2005569 RepID=UPI001131DE6A|nr:DUF3549 family protein [Lacimicrobium sp. SS2-24]
MSNISTISEFLLHANSQYQVFDMSRGIRPLPAQEFIDIENALQPFPTPRLGAAWLGILFWNSDPAGVNAMVSASAPQYFIWFLKLPLDEQSKLMPGPRDHFLRILLEALARQAEGETIKDVPDHPYSFVPPQQQMADFNAIVRKQLGLPHSDHFSEALRYIQSPTEKDWNNVPVQGISDVAAAMDDPIIEQAVLDNFDLLADEVKQPLCQAMENHQPSANFSAKILQWLATEQQPSSVLSGLRALSRSKEPERIAAFLQQLLTEERADTDMLVIISGRHWQRLKDNALLHNYMNALAQHSHALFSAVFADLVRIPMLRTQMLSLLRSPDKSPELLQAIGALFSEQRQ